MPSPLAALTRGEREAIRAALRAGRIGAPFAAAGLGALVGSARAEGIAAELGRLSALGISSAGLDEALALLDARTEPARAQVVWTGPEGLHAATQDTGVVVRQLFAAAEARVLVAGFAVYQGRAIFQALAARMAERPALEVDLYLNVARARGDTTIAADLLARFAARFREREWPGPVLPRVHHDPRALALSAGKQASLHAKCVVVDRRHVFVTSANFTEAAQERNIELGLAVTDASLAETIEAQFAWLTRERHLVRVPGL